MFGRIFSLAILLGVAGVSHAQPSFDCAKAQSSAEEAVCADPVLAALDRRMADRYAQALESARTADAGSDAAINELRGTQRGWIKGRDDCWKAEDLATCVKDAYLMREAELVADWMLEPAREIRVYTCNGNPANEVAVHYFDTELPSIRVEYGDGIKSGWQVPTASGSKFALPFGGQFWTKGDEALFEWTEGDPQTCLAAL